MAWGTLLSISFLAGFACPTPQTSNPRLQTFKPRNLRFPTGTTEHARALRSLGCSAQLAVLQVPTCFPLFQVPNEPPSRTGPFCPALQAPCCAAWCDSSHVGWAKGLSRVCPLGGPRCAFCQGWFVCVWHATVVLPAQAIDPKSAQDLMGGLLRARCT